MLESNQTRAIRLSTDSLYTTTRARLAALESLHHAQLISARRTCRQQFRTAVRELLRSQREYNSSSVRELEAALEPELRASEAAVRKSEKELRYAVDEEERLAFQNARVGLVMLKKGLFSANEVWLRIIESMETGEGSLKDRFFLSLRKGTGNRSTSRESNRHRSLIPILPLKARRRNLQSPRTHL
ncbi:hypothetical protein BDZ88DRAFT_413991 [Geranomyces variabilis]|nr:hypothetical protein BDZ88DRAFT_413991 [Geranomyces variabilis]